MPMTIKDRTTEAPIAQPDRDPAIPLVAVRYTGGPREAHYGARELIPGETIQVPALDGEAQTTRYPGHFAFVDPAAARAAIAAQRALIDPPAPEADTSER